jgi:hypothetical protein
VARVVPGRVDATSAQIDPQCGLADVAVARARLCAAGDFLLLRLTDEFIFSCEAKAASALPMRVTKPKAANASLRITRTFQKSRLQERIPTAYCCAEEFALARSLAANGENVHRSTPPVYIGGNKFARMALSCYGPWFANRKDAYFDCMEIGYETRWI